MDQVIFAPSSMAFAETFLNVFSDSSIGSLGRFVTEDGAFIRVESIILCSAELTNEIAMAKIIDRTDVILL
jgi:hypothetical protein